MNNPDTEQLAWLKLAYAGGHDHENSWKFYHSLQAGGSSLAQSLSIKDTGRSSAPPLPTTLRERLQNADPKIAEKRFRYLQKRNLRLLHPGSRVFDVPEIPGLPPTLTLWGDLGILNASGSEVLMKSRDTSSELMKSFLYQIAQGRLERRNFCFCPFSQLDWEFVEALLKTGCGMILGSVTGITRRSMALAHEYPTARLVVLAPEPPIRFRTIALNCVEALYRLFSLYAQEILLLQMSEQGKTQKRIAWAQSRGISIRSFENSIDLSPASNIQKKKPKSNSSIDRPSDQPSDSDEGDEFITML
ncbi:MAG: hypothetical protein NTW14_02475 [bacterium]|nr:hypothetical protein [bacterium]